MAPPRPKPVLAEFVWGVVVAGLATGACQLMSSRFELADLVMVYLLGVVVVSTRFSLYPSVFTALLSAVAFDVFFIPPKLSFAIFDPKHLVTLGVMLFVAITISGLTEQARRHADTAHRAEAEARTERLRSLLLSSVFARFCAHRSPPSWERRAPCSTTKRRSHRRRDATSPRRCTRSRHACTGCSRTSST